MIINPNTGQPFEATAEHVDTVAGEFGELDQEKARIMALEILALETDGLATLGLTPITAIQLAGLIQLALRKPEIGDQVRGAGEAFLEWCAEYFKSAPMLSRLLEAGTDPAQDHAVPPRIEITANTLEEAAQAIEHFVVGSNEDLERIWQPTVETLRAAAEGAPAVVELSAHLVNMLRSRAAWYAAGCYGLDDDRDDGREQYFREGLAEDAGEDLTTALGLIDAAVFAGVVRLVEGQIDTAEIKPRARPAPADATEACDLECGNRFFHNAPRCRHGRTPEETLESRRRPTP